MENPIAIYNLTHRREPRHGVVMIVVIVTISVSLVLFGMWAQNLVKEHRRFAYQQFRLQAGRLAEAGIRRAMARKSADPSFEQETWRVPAEMLGGTNVANVQIRAVSGQRASTTLYEATAQYPTDTLRSVQVTKRIEVSSPSTQSEL